MTFNTDRLETILAGVLCVTIGTAIAASNVSAQNKSSMPSPTPAAGAASCAPIETPDAMCTVPLKKGPETKICFGDHHPRCFELKNAHLIQALNGGVLQDTLLSGDDQTRVKSSINAFTTWLEKDLAKKPNKFNSCTNIVSIDSMSEHKVFCLTRLPAKDVNAKTKELLATLESPSTTAARTSSAK